MDENIDIQIITQKKEVKGAAIQGSSLISTFEEVRNLLQSGQPIFINGNEYLTHATKPSSSWPSGCIELSRDYQHGSDYSATIEFEMYSKPKAKKEKKKAEVAETTKATEQVKEKAKPISASRGKKGNTPRLEEQAKKTDADGTARKGKPEAASIVSTTVVAGSATVAVSDEAKAPATSKAEESRQIQSGKKKAPVSAKKGVEPVKRQEETHEKVGAIGPSKESKVNPKEAKQHAPQEKEAKEVAGSETVAKELMANENEQIGEENADASAQQTQEQEESSDDKIQQARLLALQRTKARKQQLEEKAKQEREREEQIKKDKQEHAAHMRVKLQNKANERLKEYEEIKRQEEIEKQEEYFTNLEKQQAAEELVQSEEYQKKVKQLRIDAKKRLKKYEQLEEQRKLEEEEKRKLALHQHTNKVRAPLPTGSITGQSYYTYENATQYDENSTSSRSLLTIPPNFDVSGMNAANNSIRSNKLPTYNSTSHVIYEEGEEEEELEKDGEIMEEDSFYSQQIPRASLPIRNDQPVKQHTSSKKDPFQPTKSLKSNDGSGQKKKHPIAIVEDEVEDEMEQDLAIDCSPSFSSPSKSKSQSKSNQSTPGKDGALIPVVALPTPIVAFTPDEHYHMSGGSNKQSNLFHRSPHAIQATATHHDGHDSDSSEDINDDDSLLYHHSLHMNKTTPMRMESSRPGSADEESVIELVEASDKVNSKKRLSKISNKLSESVQDNDSSSLSSDEDDVDDFHYKTKNESSISYASPAKPMHHTNTSSTLSNQKGKQQPSSNVQSKQKSKGSHGNASYDTMSDLSDIDNEPSSPYIKNKAQAGSILPPIKAAAVSTNTPSNTNMNTLNRSVKKKYAMESNPIVSSSIATSISTTIMTTGLAPQATIQSYKQIGSSQNQQYSPGEMSNDQGSGSSGGGGKGQVTNDMNEAIIKKKKKQFRKLPPIPIAPYNQIPPQMN